MSTPAATPAQHAHPLHDVAIDQALKAYPPTATPRTAAAWAASFSPAGPNFAVRDECEKLETELAAAKAECERLRKAGTDTWGELRQQIHAKETELDRLRADNLTAHQMACAAGLERDRLRAEPSAVQALHLDEIDELAAQAKIMNALRPWTIDFHVAQNNGSTYGCELRDPNGTIWEQAAKDHARAEKAEAECLEKAILLGMSGEREADLLGKLERLAKDTARLDWLAVSDVWFDFPATGAFTPETFRAAIDAAMKP
jgi:hypothetical protein